MKDIKDQIKGMRHAKLRSFGHKGEIHDSADKHRAACGGKIHRAHGGRIGKFVGGPLTGDDPAEMDSLGGGPSRPRLDRRGRGDGKMVVQVFTGGASPNKGTAFGDPAQAAPAPPPPGAGMPPPPIGGMPPPGMGMMPPPGMMPPGGMPPPGMMPPRPPGMNTGGRIGKDFGGSAMGQGMTPPGGIMIGAGNGLPAHLPTNPIGWGQPPPMGQGMGGAQGGATPPPQGPAGITHVGGGPTPSMPNQPYVPPPGPVAHDPTSGIPLDGMFHTGAGPSPPVFPGARGGGGGGNFAPYGWRPNGPPSPPTDAERRATGLPTSMPLPRGAQPWNPTTYSMPNSPYHLATGGRANDHDADDKPHKGFGGPLAGQPGGPRKLPPAVAAKIPPKPAMPAMPQGMPGPGAMPSGIPHKTPMMPMRARGGRLEATAHDGYDRDDDRNRVQHDGYDNQLKRPYGSKYNVEHGEVPEGDGPTKRARGGHVTLDAGAATGEGRLEKIGRHVRHSKR